MLLAIGVSSTPQSFIGRMMQMTKSICVTFDLDEEVLELLDEISEKSGEGRDKGVSTIIGLWARKGFRDDDELIDRYIAGARMAHGIVFKQNLILMLLLIAGAWALNKMNEFMSLLPVFIGSYAIFFIIRKLYNVSLDRQWRSPEKMLKSL